MSTATGNSNQLANDFKEHFAGTLSEDAVRRTVESLEGITESQLKAATAHGASGSLASLIFYVKVQRQVYGGKTFNGSAWGVSFPGGGALFGDVYLTDAAPTLDQLYSKTSSFTFTATPVTPVYFLTSRNAARTLSGGLSLYCNGNGWRLRKLVLNPVRPLRRCRVCWRRRSGVMLESKSVSSRFHDPVRNRLID